MQAVNQGAIDKIVPTMFMMTSSGTYQPQQLRSWNMAGSMMELNTLARHIEQTVATQVTPNLIATAAPGMMQVSTESQGGITIPNGWNEKRGVFVLRIDVYYRIGTMVSWIIQGYTDEPSFTERHIAPNLTFYINNVFSLAPRVTSYNGVTMKGLAMVDNFQMVSGFSGQNGVPGGNLLIRPQDVMSNITTRELGHSINHVVDTTVMASSMPQTSRHSNNIGSTMLANTLNVWHAAASSEHTSAPIDTIADKAYSNLIESDPSMDVFMNILTKANQQLGVATTSFTFHQLQQAVPEIMRVYQHINTTGGAVQFSHSGDSQHFNGQNYTTRVAVNLQTVVPSIMVESLLSAVGFSMTNETPGGVLEIRKLNVNAFSPETDMLQWDIFQRRIINEVVPLISPRGTGIGFRAIITCNFFHEFMLDITINGENVRFVAPTFCNSLTTPVQTASHALAKNYTLEMETAATHINDALMESSIRRANRNEVMMSAPGSIQAPFRSIPKTTADMHFPDAPAQVSTTGGMSLGGMRLQAPNAPMNPSAPVAPAAPFSPAAPAAPGIPQPPAAPRGFGGMGSIISR